MAVSPPQFRIMREALWSGTFSPMARLRFATAMAGTEEDLVWQLCENYRAQWYANGAIIPEVDEILQSELDTRDYWTALDTLRGKPQTEEERLARSKEMLERERGGVSDSIMDALSSSGQNADDAWREYRATYNQAMADGQVSADEQRHLRRDEAFSSRMTAEYREAKASVATWATTIAVAIVGVAATILTAGTAGPFVLALGGKVAFVAESMVMAAALKVGLNRAIQGEGYDVTSTQALVDAISASVEVGLNVVGGQVAAKFMSGVSPTRIAKSVGPAIERAFGPAGKRIIAAGVETGIDGTIGGIGEGIVQAIGDEDVWKGEIEDILGKLADKVGTNAVMSGVAAGFTGAGFKSLGEVFSPRIRGQVPDNAGGSNRLSTNSQQGTPHNLDNANGRLAAQGGQTVSQNTWRLTPGDLGHRTISETPALLQLWNQTIQGLSNTGKRNAYTSYLNAKLSGQLTPELAEEAFSYLSRKFKVAARNAGFDIATVHHWNFPKGNYADIVDHPDHLVPIYGQRQMAGGSHPEHTRLHQQTSNGDNIFTDFDQTHELPVDPNIWPIVPPSE